MTVVAVIGFNLFCVLLFFFQIVNELKMFFTFFEWLHYKWLYKNLHHILDIFLLAYKA